MTNCVTRRAFLITAAQAAAIPWLERLGSLWHRLLGRPVSEYRTLCQREGAHGRGDRRRRVLVLPTLYFRCGGLDLYPTLKPMVRPFIDFDSTLRNRGARYANCL